MPTTEGRRDDADCGLCNDTQHVYDWETENMEPCPECEPSK